MIKRIILLLTGLIFGLLSHSQTWIDITDKYIVNPNYNDNDVTTGWSGTELGKNNPFENAEHYNKTYDSYQDLNGLKAGKYRLSLSAFYRMGDSGNDYQLYSSGNYTSSQHAKIYATSSASDYEVAITPSSSAALTESLGGDVRWVGNGNWWEGATMYCIPNNMEAAHYWFESGYYKNTLEFEVDDDGVLRIGIRKYTNIDSDWTCIDTWKLEYWGTVTQATSLKVARSSMTMVPSETYTLGYTILPEDATYDKVSWSSSNTSIATVSEDGVITALSTGICIITAKTIDGSNLSSRCVVTVKNSKPTSENIIINEIMASNVDVYLDPNQNYGSWVEIYNPTSESVAIGNLYISDDASNLKKNRLTSNYGTVPANGFAILNFDHHENFTTLSYRQIDDKLDYDGGEIIISDGTDIIARQTYPAAISRVSYARTTDGGSTWTTCGTPTPGASNQDASFATTRLPAPEPDQAGQVFSGNLQVCVNIPAGATLLYTTDGTAPTLTNGTESATGIFDVSQTTCYRFRFFQEGYLPSEVVTRSYIASGNYPFPIISVVTDAANIYDKDRGVFMQGQYGRPGSGQTTKSNWNMDWDRPVSFEYITTSNENLINQECDLSMCGGWSRAWSPHAFKLKANKLYEGRNFFAASLFDKKPYIKNKVLQIRNGGNDTSCRIKDPAIQGIVSRSGLNVDYQEWQPVHVFINGSHYAVLNMREPNNKDYAYSNQGIDTDFMDQFEMSPDSGYVQMRGSRESFQRLVNLSSNASDPSTYTEICQLLDIDEYINYMAVELYCGNWDWPQNNVKAYRDQNNGKYRFVLFDMDGSLSTSTPFQTFFGKEHYTFDNLHGYDYSKNKDIEGTTLSKPIDVVTLFKNLLENAQFRKQFIDTFCIIGGSVFTPSHVQEIVSEMRTYLSQGNYVNPSGTANDLINKFSSSYMSNMINQLKSNSHDAIKNELSSLRQQSVTLSTDTKGAKILLNGIELPYCSFSGYLFAPTKLKAVAPSGYKFNGWRSVSGTTNGVSLINKQSDWRYYDQGSLDGTDWKSSINTRWSSGNAPLGYYTSDSNNGRGYKTTLNYGSSSNNKYPTYYFARTVRLNESPRTNDSFVLDFTVDDGFIIYVNGKEAGRYNMPSGNVTFSNYSTTYANGNPDSGTLTLASSLFKTGENIIAVEVHNNSGSSTDIYWDASLTQYKADSGSLVSSDEEYTIPTTGTISLVASFSEQNQDELKASVYRPIKVNEVSAGNSVYINDYFKKNDWIELYNATDTDLDISGLYVSDDIDQPMKYQISSNGLTNTIIPSGGHIILWADKLEPQTQLHTNFKLSNTTGESVVITSSDTFVSNNKKYFEAHPDMESFADGLTYEVHNGNESCGRYPDGGKSLYKMVRTTICSPNSIQPSEISYGEDEDITSPHTDDFTLSLHEGWNWISSVLADPLSPSSLTDASHIIGRSTETIKSDGSWSGSLKNLYAGNLYKADMTKAATYTFSQTLCRGDLPIGVQPGWNWIGYTSSGSQNLSSALESVPLQEGDIIMGQDGFSVFTDGSWSGNLTTLEGGKGYMFKSGNTKTLTFNTPSVKVNIRHKVSGKLHSGFQVDRYAYPDVMGMTCKLVMNGATVDSERFIVAAFDEDGCAGVGQSSDSLVYISLYASPGSLLQFKAIDTYDGMEYEIAETATFKSDVVGLPSRPFILTLNADSGTPTSIDTPDEDNDNNPRHSVNCKVTGYYSVGGQLISTKYATLPQGIYIVKYNDGTHHKIYVR